MKYKTPITLKQFVINNLRKASYKWGPKNAAKNKVKLARNQYVCKHCSKVFPNKEIQIDHVMPIIDPTVGWQGFDVYIERLFCDEDGFQVLCLTCHDKKTSAENEIRKLMRSVKRETNGSK